MRARLPLAAIVVALSGPALAQDVTLAPHRAVYDLSLVNSSGARSVDSARGRIVFEIGGAACVGYTVTFRQVLELTSERGATLTDVSSTNFEDGDGSSFRFVIDRRDNVNPPRTTEGRAKRAKDDVTADITKPKEAKVSLGANVVFPTDHTRRIIAAAIRGETIVELPFYDGSEEGERTYDTLAIIGKPNENAADPRLEEPLKKLEMGKLRRWPVKLSYYKKGTSGDGTPIYVLNFDLYENGISGAIRLDYGTVVLKGEMKQLELTSPPKC